LEWSLDKLNQPAAEPYNQIQNNRPDFSEHRIVSSVTEAFKPEAYFGMANIGSVYDLNIPEEKNRRK
jgi:hypothetical protein